MDLLTQCLCELVFKLEGQSRREAAQGSQLKLVSDRVPSRLVVGNGSKRLVGPARLHCARCWSRVVQIEQAFQVSTFVPDVRSSHGGVPQDFMFEREVPLLMIRIPAVCRDRVKARARWNITGTWKRSLKRQRRN